jgi:hypothetical protein
MRTAEVVNKEREEKRKFNRDKRTEAGIGNSLYSGSLIKKKKRNTVAECHVAAEKNQAVFQSALVVGMLETDNGCRGQ